MKKLFSIIAVLMLVLTLTINISAKEVVKDWVSENGASTENFFFGSAADTDGGFVAVGYTDSTIYGGNNIGGKDAVITKFTKTGDIAWTRNFGGSAFDTLTSVTRTSDGNFVAVGHTYSRDKDINSQTPTGNLGIILKFNAKTGKTIWLKYFEGDKGVGAPVNDYQHINKVIETKEKNIVIVGYTSSTIDGVTPGSSGDAFIAVLDSNGNYIKSKMFGGLNLLGDDYRSTFSSVKETKDHYVVVGKSRADIFGLAYNTTTMYNGMPFIALINKSDLTHFTSQSFGGEGYESLNDVAVINDNEFYAVGYVASNGGALTGVTVDGRVGAVVAKFSLNNNTLSRDWAKDYKTNISYSADDKTTLYSAFNSVVTTSDGGCYVAGYLDTPLYYESYNFQDAAIIVKYTKDGDATLVYEHKTNTKFDKFNSISINEYDDIFAAGAVFLQDNDHMFTGMSNVVLAVKHSTFYDLNYHLGDGTAGNFTNIDRVKKGLNTLAKVSVTHPQNEGRNVYFIGWSLTNPNNTIFEDIKSAPKLIKNLNITDDTTVYAIYSYAKGSADPNTGDDSNVYLALAFMSIGLVSALILINNRKTLKNN